MADTLSQEEILRVKSLGCLRDKRHGDVFNVRVITGFGKLDGASLRAIAGAAEQFGSGEVALTTRLTMEIQGVPYENIEPLRAFLARHGLETGGTGRRVRPVVACKGTTCQYGLIDTFALGEAIHRRFFQGYAGVTLPHKFKIAVGGCPNNCVKPDLNDVGIMGQCVPRVDEAACRGCGKCQVEAACPVQVCAVAGGKLRIDRAACRNCGRCVGKCPFGALTEERRGYQLYLGGHWGKSVGRGHPLSRLLTSEDEVMEVLERTLLFYRDHGRPGERLAHTIERLGFAAVERAVLPPADGE